MRTDLGHQIVNSRGQLVKLLAIDYTCAEDYTVVSCWSPFGGIWALTLITVGLHGEQRKETEEIPHDLLRGWRKTAVGSEGLEEFRDQDRLRLG